VPKTISSSLPVNPDSRRPDYAAWRRDRLDEQLVREGGGAQPAERLLQVIWQHQRLKPGALRMTDGRRVRVLHPGFCNFEAGPDFRKAVLQFDDEPPVCGEVEIDVAVSGWHAHGHDTNPSFRDTLLRVVWTAPGSGGAAVLPLKPNLECPWNLLKHWAAAEPLGDLPAKLHGLCCAPMSEASDDEVRNILRQAARVRLESKSTLLRNRAKHSGWEQALWEGLFTGLGYKQNQWPMRNLAIAIPELRERLGRRMRSSSDWLAVLLGIGGLLPVELPRSELKKSEHLRKLWDVWWRLRDELAHLIQPPEVWRMSGVRPANRPERRLALAAQWLADASFIRRLEQWFTNANKEPDSARLILPLLNGQPDDFWESHFTFSSRPLKRPAPLLGPGRATDMAINTILPWFYARANAGKDQAVREQVGQIYFNWPRADDNAVLKLARQRLLGTVSTKLFKTAAHQQGLLQIVRDFCAKTDSLCTDCPFPDYVKAWSLR